MVEFISEETVLQLSLFLTIIIIWCCWKWNLRNQRLPPGPIGLPILGFMPFVGRQAHQKFSTLAQLYGNVFSVYMGNKLTVVLSDLKSVKECFLNDNFSGRPEPFNLVGWFFDYKDITSTEGEEWKFHRRLTLRKLRDFGFGKINTENKMIEEAENFMSFLRKQKGQPFDVNYWIELSTTNTIANFVMGHRFDYDDPKLIKMLQLVKGTTAAMGAVAVVEIFPILRYLPYRLTSMDVINNCKQETQEYFKEIIKQHEENLTLNPDNPKDLIDEYLIKFKELENEDDNLFKREHILQNAITIFLTGIETTSASLAWVFKLMAKHQEIQTRVRNEIEHVVGFERLVSWDDRNNLPYTQATFYEVFRWSTITPFALPHSNPNTATLFEYEIPARSRIIANYWHLHHDPDVWTNPEEFRPERFLDENTGRLNQNDKLLALFSLGRRICMGEPLARMEVFFFFSVIVQNFYIQPPENQTIDMECEDGVIRAPKTCFLRFIPRA